MNDDFGTRLGATLRENTPAPHTHLTLDDVAPTARRIKRRRTGAVLGGVVALTAVSALGAALVLPSLTANSPGREVLGPATTGETPWNLPGQVVLAKDATVVFVGGNSDEWLMGDGQLGPEIPIPFGAHDAFARLGDRWLVSFQDGPERKLYSIQLAHEDPFAPGADIVQAIDEAETFELYDNVAVSDGGDLAVFSTPSGALTLIDADGETREITTLPTPGTPIDLIGDAGCIDGTDCQVVISYGDGGAPEIVDGDGTRTVISEQAVAADAATADGVATRADGGDSAPCTTVSERSTGDTRWETCEVSVKAFSPDGRFAVVVDAYQSGIGPTRMGVADAATGEVLTWFVPGAEQGFVGDFVWRTDGGVEISSYTEADRAWRLHRVAPDGAVTQFIAPRATIGTGQAHIAVTRP